MLSPFVAMWVLLAPGQPAASSAPAPLPLVVLDPGHGGSATGARGICGVWEKDVVLQVAKKCAALLEASELARPLLTRCGDSDLGLEARTQMANAAGAQLFVSIHANASPNAEAHGIETFFLSQQAASNRLRRLLDRENDGRRVRRAKVQDPLQAVLSGMAMDAMHARSQQLAMQLQRSMADALLARGRGVLQAPFMVLMGSRMPSALVEIGFLTHAEECLHLISDHGQDNIAQSIVAGILEHLSEGEL